MVEGQKKVLLGTINAVFGLRGGVKIFSYCRPREQILKYRSFVAEKPDGSEIQLTVKNSQSGGKNIPAVFNNFEDRDQAASLIGTKLWVLRSQLPKLPDDEFYWCDLISLTVINREGEKLGKVREIFPTGANDVLVIKPENPDTEDILIPLVYEKFVEKVDLTAQTIFVDWQADW